LRYVNIRPSGAVRLVYMKHRKWLIAAAILLLLVAAGWWRFGRGSEVAAAAAVRGTAVEIVYATGGVEPVHWAKVASVIRDRIIEVCDCEGKSVAKGDVLARLDDGQVRAGLKELKAREEFLKREMSRVSELITRGAATTQAHERAAMDLQTVQGLISVQTEKISDYTIVAPMDGVVLRRDGEIGEIAEAGQILFRVGVPKPLQVVAEVNEEDIPRVAIGLVALFRTDAFPDQRLEGKVNEITPMGDVAAKTFRVKMRLPDETPLKPGMSVEANIVSREKPNALLIPADALQGNAVFVLDGAHVRKREVKIGIRGTRQVEVLSGLTDGERVASPAATDLHDGDRVRVIDSRP
jgi:RND family efflux transporter MFP subunit